MADKCRICGDYMYDWMGPHRCRPSYQVVIIGNDAVPTEPFEIREQLRVVRMFSDYGPADAVENAVTVYHNQAAEYSSNTVAGAMTWQEWLKWDADHEDDDGALLDPALMIWYEVAAQMEVSYRASKLGVHDARD